jgi:hypothetical protein
MLGRTRFGVAADAKGALQPTYVIASAPIPAASNDVAATLSVARRKRWVVQRALSNAGKPIEWRAAQGIDTSACFQRLQCFVGPVQMH